MKPADTSLLFTFVYEYGGNVPVTTKSRQRGAGGLTLASLAARTKCVRAYVSYGSVFVIQRVRGISRVPSSS